jgi:hypothetical protein
MKEFTPPAKRIPIPATAYGATVRPSANPIRGPHHAAPGIQLDRQRRHQNIRLGGIAFFLRSQFQNDAARAADWQRAALSAHLGKKLEGKEVKASKANAL